MAEGEIVVVSAHPYPSRSRGVRALSSAVRDLPGLQVRSLYDLYPDFDIDVAAEQGALEAARLVVWLTPLYWYGVPGMMKHWFDRVLLKGWAHGEEGRALHGKGCLWAVTTGGGEADYAPGSRHVRPFADFVPPIEYTARYCGMRWLEPHVAYEVHALSDAQLEASGRALRLRLEQALPEFPPAPATPP